jgi:glutamate--cysteine ligase
VPSFLNSGTQGDRRGCLGGALAYPRLIWNGAYHATKAALARLRSGSTCSASFRNGYDCTARIEHLSFARTSSRELVAKRLALLRELVPSTTRVAVLVNPADAASEVLRGHRLDYSGEADMVKKLRVSLALQPVATAIFANSPFTEGKPNGFLSFRSEIWRDTDPDRSGMLPWAFELGMGFERYVDYALDVPMYFVKRGEHYIDVAGQSFRDLMQGRLPGMPGECATISDWANHISTIFPEVRLKRYLEMRGADGGPWRRLPALPAYWVGILYDDDALDAAWNLVKTWTAEERQKLRDEVPKLGFAAVIAGCDVLQLAKTTVALAEKGLARRRRLDRASHDESRYLQPIQEYVARGITPAQELLKKFENEWNRSLAPVFKEYAY